MQRAALILCYLVGGSDQPTARDESMTTTKPYTIPNRLVWESYQRVKANRGASGIDEQTLEEFDKGLVQEPLQALEPPVLGELLSPAGEGSGNTDEGDFATLKKLREYNEHDSLDALIKAYR